MPSLAFFYFHTILTHLQTTERGHLFSCQQEAAVCNGRSIFIFCISYWVTLFSACAVPCWGNVQGVCHTAELGTAWVLRQQIFNWKKESGVFFFNGFAIIIIVGFTETKCRWNLICWREFPVLSGERADLRRISSFLCHFKLFSCCFVFSSGWYFHFINTF